MIASGKYTRTAEHRLKQSRILKGAKRTEEQKQNISKGKLKFYATEKGMKVRKKMAESNTGRIVSKKTRKKISIANKGKIRSAEVCSRMNKDKLGIPLSKEHKEKISLALTGRERIFTEEWKNNMRKKHKHRKEK